MANRLASSGSVYTGTHGLDRHEGVSNEDPTVSCLQYELARRLGPLTLSANSVWSALRCRQSHCGFLWIPLVSYRGFLGFLLRFPHPLSQVQVQSFRTSCIGKCRTGRNPWRRGKPGSLKVPGENWWDRYRLGETVPEGKYTKWRVSLGRRHVKIRE